MAPHKSFRTLLQLDNKLLQAHGCMANMIKFLFLNRFPIFHIKVKDCFYTSSGKGTNCTDFCWIVSNLDSRNLEFFGFFFADF